MADHPGGGDSIAAMSGRGSRTGARRGGPIGPTPIGAVVLGLAMLVGACGGSTPTPTPQPTVVPTPTPDPHLTEPVSAGRIQQALQKAGFAITANSADAGVQGAEPRTTLNLTYESWPLLIVEYSSTAALQTSTGFDPKRKLVLGEPPFEFAALNLLIQYGPHTSNGAPTAPEPRFVDAARRLVAVLDPLIGPLRERAVAPVPLPTAIPTAGASASSAAGTPSGAASPTP